MFGMFNSNTTGITFRAESEFCEVRGAQSLVFYVVCCRSLFVFLSVFLWKMYCLSFVDRQLFITILVPSNFSIFFLLSDIL